MAITTLDIGEESGYSLSSTEPTTLIVGEEDPKPTTLSLGEEEPEPTTMSLAEEDDPKSFDGGVVNPFGAF
jgi:hypothetical protein